MAALRSSVFAAIAAVVQVAVAAPTTAAPQADEPIQVPLTGVFRLCDHDAATFTPTDGYGRGVALISTAGNRLSAQVSLLTAPLNTHYVVRLIQVPRSSAAPCGPGGPGVTTGGLDTDAVGNGATTVEDAIGPGSTGAWVFVERPGQYSQTPDEHYTSDFIAAL